MFPGCSPDLVRTYRVPVTTHTPSAAPRQPRAVEFADVCRSFGSVQALDQATWGAAAGEVTCVLGPNGAGKSTSMEIAVGLQRPDAGTARVLGSDPWRSSAQHRARVGMMLQDGGLPQSAKPVAVIRHLASFYDAPWPVEDLCALLGISDFAGTAVRRLSGGQRKRLALAAALVGIPDVVFLDEPTAGLDPQAARVTHEIVRDVAARGAAVVLSTHTFTEAERLADHVVIMARGNVVSQGSVEEICAGASLEDRYFALTDGDAHA